MWGKIMIPIYRLWLHGSYGLYGPRCPLFPEKLLNLITHSLTCAMLLTIELNDCKVNDIATISAVLSKFQWVGVGIF